ncbi:pyroglutamyl-peptidase I [Undibacterium sp. Jales W-56]|uniref:pyroglutamyl-peptidase I n=1 Tax=Undibacterium sp. Jales W-56 TaxID=2897325 RepID=UPI0021D01F4A|nr:pyroglutamyl-peptidase I [Undibacterium sp. Jales W-56]MCU6433105.1 pyroglutamyl-peptidase I [Undibacterium sp. Jales W-56]
MDKSKALPIPVLVTGFDPFEDQAINPSWEVAKALDGWQYGDATVVARQLPCVFHEAINSLQQAMDDIKPSLIICLGQAGGRTDISLERIAINLDDARIPDNADQQPIDQAIIAKAPAAYFSSLPIKAIVRQISGAGIAAAVSNTAGTFVCNHVFFGLMHIIAQKNRNARTRPPVRGGFVHLPYLPEQVSAYPGTPSIPLDAMIKGIQTAIQTAIDVKTDIVETGGQLH